MSECKLKKTYSDRMNESMSDIHVRLKAFGWLDSMLQEKPWLTWAELLKGIETESGRIPLISQRGIWNPRELDSTLSITSTASGPYEDFELGGFQIEYAYQGESGSAGNNLKLRRAFETQTPLIYFKQLQTGIYLPHYPVYVVSDDPNRRIFTIDLTGSVSKSPTESLEIDKEYVERRSLARLHQPRFRAEVLLAYRRACAICQLKHVELLDAAHIIPDSEPNGSAAVSNGLALCKIHHAAYDSNVLGISPDYVVRMRPEILEEVDGPMLKHGLQAMDGKIIFRPNDQRLAPNKNSLAWRFEKFLAA